MQPPNICILKNQGVMCDRTMNRSLLCNQHLKVLSLKETTESINMNQKHRRFNALTLTANVETVLPFPFNLQKDDDDNKTPTYKFCLIPDYMNVLSSFVSSLPVEFQQIYLTAFILVYTRKRIPATEICHYENIDILSNAQVVSNFKRHWANTKIKVKHQDSIVEVDATELPIFLLAILSVTDTTEFRNSKTQQIEEAADPKLPYLEIDTNEHAVKLRNMKYLCINADTTIYTTLRINGTRLTSLPEPYNNQVVVLYSMLDSGNTFADCV